MANIRSYCEQLIVYLYYKRVSRTRQLSPDQRLSYRNVYPQNQAPAPPKLGQPHVLEKPQLWRKVEAYKIATGEEAYPEEARHGKQNGRRNGPNSKRQKKEADAAIAPTTDTAARMT